MRRLRKLAYAPGSLWRRFIDRLSHWFRRRKAGATALAHREQWPNLDWTPWSGWGMDLADKGDSYVLRCDVPELGAHDVRVAVVGDMLVLHGRKAHTHEERGRSYYHFAALSGQFYRAVPLPEDVDPRGIRAVRRRGGVEIRLPKRAMAAVPVYRIPVQAA